MQYKWLYTVAYGCKGNILLLTVISAIIALLGVWSALLIKNLIDIAGGVLEGNLLETGALFALTLVAEITMDALYDLLNTHTKTKQANNLRSKLFRKFMTAQWQALSARHSGDYCNRMISDVDVVNGFLLSSIPDIISTLVQLLAATWVLLLLGPGLAVLALTITPVFILLGRLLAKPMRDANLQIQNLRGEQLSHTQEAIQNITNIRAFEQQGRACDRLDSLHGSLLFWVMRRTKLGVLSRAIQAISWSGTYCLSLLWGIARLSQNALSYGTIAAYLQLVAQIQGPLRQLAGQIPQIIATSASISRLLDVLNLPEEAAHSTPCENFSSHPNPLGLRLDHVCFAYKDSGPVLEKLSMDVPPGAIAALIGPTGEGKSTVLRLLLGLVTPQAGSILLYRPDGDSYPVGACTRSAFTYVQQGNATISGTIADNLRMAKPSATMEEMETVLKQACAWDFVSALPQKTQTCIGDHGSGLSEGQQQCLAISRALLRDAPILILDEATSALDKKTEAQVLKNIQSALQGRTCLVITHRSAALKLCSRMYRLYGGKAYLSTTNFKNSHVRFKVKKNRSYFRAAPAS